MRRPRFSVVVPVHNERETLPELASRLSAVLDGLDGNSEVILVDDGSEDGSHEILLELHFRDPRFKVIRLARNFGHQMAITAGLDFAQGDAVVVMDGDLQDPPELIPDLVARWREGYEVVYAVREGRRGESVVKRATAAVYYRVFRRLAGVDVPLDVGDFRLVDRRALAAFRSLRERNRYVRGMFSWIGFRHTGVPYRRHERFAGKPSYSYGASLRLALDGLLSFSAAPLKLALLAGFLISAGAFLVGAFALVAKLAGGDVVPGWASILVVVSLLGGFQLMLIGVLGLYVGNIYEEVKARPLYVIREAHGVADSAREHAPHPEVVA